MAPTLLPLHSPLRNPAHPPFPGDVVGPTGFPVDVAVVVALLIANFVGRMAIMVTLVHHYPPMLHKFIPRMLKLLKPLRLNVTSPLLHRIGVWTLVLLII
ncbi:hypothetical protein HanXRQr2_Chr01g0025951 [Helianthus annuus]|uniref:Uncharacterized protein n=2 Tax=Helianthus annuus TaxID=4232 RepID=A0A9K3JVP7_HELAN|nr:hypothetical protein HanXRQr2_Chr01g0025951 [Helianthus annuus]KAJ0957250.1 hypothetical protein HanPSC8_Chr01g0025061 [Helianthus annuus]